MSFFSPSNQITTIFLRHCIAALSFLLTSISVQARNYYISSSLGNDSYTLAQAQNQATPWRSISKLNSIFSTLVAGDAVYFKRGDTFYGSITVNKSGSSGNPIIISAYGTGNRPVITGLTTLSSWSSVGNGVYQATASGISNSVNLVTLNDQPQHIGRYPNINAANDGYLTFESSTSRSITDNTLSSSPNWTGAELVVRKARHVVERWPISSHSGNTITYTGSFYPTTNNGYGYFFQKDIRTLDQLGEWYYNTSTKYMQMYFGSNGPSSNIVQVSTVDILLNISAYSYITVSELAFEGANNTAINFGITQAGSVVSGISIQNCDFDLGGRNAIFGTNTSNLLIERCNINNSFNNAIEIENEGGISRFVTIRRNNIKNTGLKRGMGASFGNSLQGITTYASDATIEYNNIENTGYIPIAFFYSNAKIRNNYINNFLFTKDDGGGIYTFNGPRGGPVYTGREVKNNIVINGIGAPLGTPHGERTVDGIYMDDGTAGVDISGNSVANAHVAGIYLHNSHEITVANNTVFNCNLQQILYVNDANTPTDPIRNTVLKKNIMVAKTADQLCFMMRTINDDINQTGPTDSNYYVRPADDDLVFGAWTSVLKTTYSLERWKANFTKDVHSKKSPKTILPYKINSLTTGNLLSGGDFLNSALGLAGLSFWSSNSNQSAAWDGTSKLTGTGSLRVSFPSSVANLYTICTKTLGVLSSGKNYIVRFSTLGSNANGLVGVYLNNTLTNTALVPKQSASFNTTRKEHEFLFTPTATASTSGLIFEIQQNSGTTYIDNLEIFEANISLVDMDDQMRFEYNATESPITISLGAKYIDVDNAVYNGSVTLQPYTSKVLFWDGTATSGGTLTAAATAPVISCFGGSTTATVTASGGRTPYTGTGSFTVNAGNSTLKISAPNPVANSYTAMYSSIGAVSSAKTYVLRFSTLGTSSNGSLRAGIRQTNSPWDYVSSTPSRTFGTARVNHEFTFSAPETTSDASFIIEILQSSGVTYIDNIAFFEANSTGVLISDNLYSSGQFESGIGDITTWSNSDNHVAEWDRTSKIANTYYYPVRDANGATATASVATSQPAAALRASSTAGQVIVAGGTTTVVVSATGGTTPYSGTGNFTNVRVGTYSYTVTDARGCTSVTTITVSQSAGTGFAAAADVPDINCFGGSTTATVVGTGGSAPYTGTGAYTVNAGRGSLRISVANPVDNAYTFVYSPIGPVSSSRSYVLKFSTLGTTDDGGLRASIRQANSPWDYITPMQSRTFGTDRVDHEFIFTAPETQSAASFLIEVLQSSGTTYIDNIAFFEATSAGVPVNSNLFSSGQFESDISDIETWSLADNHTAQLDLTSKISNTYYYRVSDASGRVAIATAETSQPVAPLQASSSAGTVTVTGGTTTVVVTATGGTAPYTGTGSFGNVRVGTYNYTVTDANGCTAVTTITVTQSSGASFSANATTPAISCFGGNTTATVTASGGISPYIGTGSYSVNAGRGTLRISVNTPVPSLYTLIYSSIGEVSDDKTYLLRFSTLGTTSNGQVKVCLRRSDPQWGTITSKQLASFGTTRIDHEFLFVAPEATDDASFLIEILQSSGTTYIDNIAFFEANSSGDPISNNLYSSGQFENTINNIYSWSASNNHTASLDLTSKINNIYYYSVRDATGAISTAAAVTTQPASALLATSTAGNVTVTGGTTTVVVSATGGTPPYTGTGSFANVRVGTYNYTVRDARGCTSVTTITVTQNAASRAANPITQNIVPNSVVGEDSETGDSPTGLSVSANTRNLSNELRISSYPNPARSEFGLMIEGGTSEMVHISILSVDGRVIYRTKGNTNARYVIANNFVPGIYIVKVLQGKVNKVLRVVKATY